MKDYQTIVEVLASGWRETRRLTIDFLDCVTVEQLNTKLDRPGLDTFAKQIWEMTMVERAFLEVIEGKPLSFDAVEAATFGDVEYLVRDKAELKELLHSADSMYERIVAADTDWAEGVEMFGATMPKWSVLEALIRHETLHHGQFAAYMYAIGIPFPSSWVQAWAFPQQKMK
jgi:uncharacterized damage-inducible protein DinB